jgi:hypothetical protein
MDDEVAVGHRTTDFPLGTPPALGDVCDREEGFFIRSGEFSTGHGGFLWASLHRNQNG